MRSIFLCSALFAVFSIIFIPELYSITKHKVKSGDTLYNLSRKYNSEVSKIKKANNLRSDNLRIGKILIIPENAYDPESRIYTVKNGDTLGGIAEKFGYSSRVLVKYNSMDSPAIKIGQKIMIPESQNVPSPALTVVPRDESDEEFVMVGPEKPENNSQDVTENSIEQNEINDESGTVTTYYTVKKGDTLSEICEKLDIEFATVKKLNGLTGSDIAIGQKLVITGHSSQDYADNKVTAPDKHTIRSGDTLSEIAEKYGVKTSSLRAYNDLSTNRITVGKELRIPGSDYVPPPDIEKTDYRVRSGDTLSSIALRFGTSINTIKSLNNLDTNHLRAGESIYVPASGLNNAVETVDYTVRSGDTLGNIAQRFGVSVASVKSLNGISSSLIRKGQKIRIPRQGLSSRTVERDIDHTVRKGESLFSIARKYGSTVNAIKSTNGIIGSDIRINQILKVPVSENLYSRSQTRSRYSENTGIADNGNSQDISDSLIEVAKKYLGAPYKFGGNSTDTGIDCSAYVKKVYSFFDVSLPRTARDIFKQGDWVKKSSLEKGDLVFFRTYAQYPSHVGIYLGNDKFIHASSASKKVTITSFKKNYYQRRFIGAKRIPIEGVFYDDVANKL